MVWHGMGTKSTTVRADVNGSGWPGKKLVTKNGSAGQAVFYGYPVQGRHPRPRSCGSWEQEKKSLEN